MDVGWRGKLTIMTSEGTGFEPPRYAASRIPEVTEPGDGKGRWLNKKVLAWSLWDWGSASFNAVITTFVFAVYITSDSFGPDAETNLGWAMALAGLLIALFAPVAGQRADRSGRRSLWLAVNTFLVVLASAALFFVEASPSHLWLGLALLGIGNVFFEFASVNYYAMLNGLSNSRNIGRVSGFGWGLGYIGGIVLLLILFVGFINPDVGWFGVTSENGMDVRVSMLFAALWFALFALPVVISIRDEPRQREQRRPEGIIESYRLLFATIKRLWRTDPNSLKFLIASAVFRDGMAGVFAFAGVIAASVFGFGSGDVIIFAIVANLVAGLATIGFGWIDDWVGPKLVIQVSLISMISCGVIIFFLNDLGTWVYWVFGLSLAVFVGPVQSASRSYLSRIIPEGKEGEMFGLYATTGRAVSFMSPAAYSLAIAFGALATGMPRNESSHFGILGLSVILFAGLLLTLQVKRTNKDAALGSTEITTEESTS